MHPTTENPLCPASQLISTNCGNGGQTTSEIAHKQEVISADGSPSTTPPSGCKDLRPRAALHDRRHQAMLIVCAGRKKCRRWSTRQREMPNDASLCFVLEPTPRS